MAFSMFSAQVSPIAINFGSTSAKLLQVSFDERPQIVAAAEIELPEEMWGDYERALLHYEQHLPKVLKECRFRGKKVVTAVPTAQTLIQHMRLSSSSDAAVDEQVKAQLQAQVGVALDGVVVRSIGVDDAPGVAPGKAEYITFAVARDIVMRYIGMLQKRKLEVAGMHTEAMSTLRAFDHLNRREEDADVTTMYLDVGYSGVRTVLAHGKQMVFARFFPLGGRAFDQHIANDLHCDLSSANSHRRELASALSARQAVPAIKGAGAAILNAALSGGGGGGGGGVAEEDRRQSQTPRELQHGIEPDASTEDLVDFSEPLAILSDEVRMSARYYRSLFPERGIDRVIFVGGESHHLWVCQHLLSELGMRGQLGDPLSRFARHDDTRLHNVDLDCAHPGWATACGLCVAPCDV